MNRLSFPLFIVTLLFAPLAFGSVETWSIALVEILIFLNLLVFFFPNRNKQPFAHIPGVIPLLLLPTYLFLQVLPLPADLVHFIAPNIYETYAPLLNLQESKNWIPLTVNQRATLLECIRISSYAGFYILTVQLLSRKEQLTKTARTVVWLAIGIAFFAILQEFTSPDKLYWFRSTPEGSGAIGPWVYHNHYAGFMELVFPLVLAHFFYYRPKFDKQQSLRERTTALFTAPGSNLHFFIGFGIILIIASVFIALSRGGTIAITLGLFLFLALLSRKKVHSGKITYLLIFTCILLAITWLGWEPVLSKFNRAFTETGGINNARLLIWQDCAPFIRDFFLTGAGFGTFSHVFPSYTTIPTSSIFNHAHNDYIELLTDGGLVGFGLAAWFVLAVLSNGIKMLGKRHESYSILLTIAGITAIFSILLHSVTDFNMHNGANGLYFFFICGVLVSAGNTRLHYRTRHTLLGQGAAKYRYFCFAAAPLLILSIFLQGGILAGKKHYQETKNFYLNPRLSETLFHKLHTTINEAIRYDPLNGLYSYYQGTIFSYQNQLQPATDSYLKASLKDPLEGAYLQRLALTLPPEKEETAKELMDKGFIRSHNKEQLILTWLDWLLQHNRLEEASNALRTGIERNPKLARQLPPLLLRGNLSRETIVSILPDNTFSWIQLGSFSEKQGNLEDAEYYRLHALDFIKQEETIKAGYFYQIYRFYKRQKMDHEAADILRRGIEKLPDHIDFHILLGNYYKKQDIPYRAIEEYQQALLLDPGNIHVQKRLKHLQSK